MATLTNQTSSTRKIRQKLRTAEHYINTNVLDRWEANGGDVWEDADPRVYVKLGLREFVGDDFRKNVRFQLDELTEEMHKELFGGRSSAAGSSTGLREPVSAQNPDHCS
jgi:hypothetical protein